MTISDKDKRDVQELLPWHLNGTLGDDESKRVRALVAASAELTDESTEVDALLASMREDVAVPMLTHERIERVMARLDDEMPASDTVVALPTRRPSRPGSAWFAIAAAFALVAVFVAWPSMQRDEGAYRTLYDDRPVIPVAVRLTDGVSADDAEAMFTALSLEAKALGDGSYRVQLPEGTSVKELFTVLQSLRADGRVAVAEALTEED